jgi:hypothetical protein
MKTWIRKQKDKLRRRRNGIKNGVQREKCEEG